MTLLLAACFVPIFKTYQNEVTNLDVQAMADLEAYRIRFLMLALAVVVIGILFSYRSAKVNANG